MLDAINFPYEKGLSIEVVWEENDLVVEQKAWQDRSTSQDNDLCNERAEAIHDYNYLTSCVLLKAIVK